MCRACQQGNHHAHMACNSPVQPRSKIVFPPPDRRFWSVWHSSNRVMEQTACKRNCRGRTTGIALRSIVAPVCNSKSSCDHSTPCRIIERPPDSTQAPGQCRRKACDSPPMRARLLPGRLPTDRKQTAMSPLYQPVPTSHLVLNRCDSGDARPAGPPRFMPLYRIRYHAALVASARA